MKWEMLKVMLDPDNLIINQEFFRNNTNAPDCKRYKNITEVLDDYWIPCSVAGTGLGNYLFKRRTD